ncbi:MAG TPA: family 20 glycosylhydrolase, partial [Kiritimatiellia bacterium]|nr:family 20 glycosylhydrolase [Kiritimatiellia bacterium]
MPPPRSLEPAEGEVVAIGGWRWKEGCPFEGGGEELGSAPWGEVEARRVEDLPDQGYRLRVAGREAVIEAGSATGFRYGWVTLGQWTRAHRKGVPPVRIEDWPDFPVRGIMLDISRNKVPTMAALKELVREVAGWKINHLQLYTEHTFAYRNHREVWKDASPMTAEEIRDLAGWCREWGIELAPNQNCFGHLTTWLKLPGYRHLAECPEGFVTPWGERRKGPFSLNPLHPGSLKLVEEWLDELLPLFESGRVNVGCDETFDLGQGASAEACRERGKGRVYLEYVKRLEELVSKRGFRMMFWGDIILKHPELIPELPQEVIALNWGYEANHPFEKECAAFAEAGVPFWVCPGTSMWNSITGRHGNAMANLEGAAREGRRHGAEGFLITEWGDNGHWQPWTFSRIPLLAGAGFGWNGEGMATVDLAGVVAQTGC